MIYTSYFGNYRNFPANSIAVSITRFPPKNWKGLELKSVAPTADKLMKLKNNEIDETVFGWQYLAQLNKDENLRPRVQALLRHLDETYGNVILCCYETTNDFCHRHLLADWLNINIKELGE